MSSPIRDVTRHFDYFLFLVLRFLVFPLTAGVGVTAGATPALPVACPTELPVAPLPAGRGRDVCREWLGTGGGRIATLEPVPRGISYVTSPS